MAEEHDPLAAFERKLAELRAQFVVGLPDRSSALRRAAKAASPAERAELREQGHKLSGTAGSYGFATLSEHARALEVAILDERPNEVLESMAHALADACDAVAVAARGASAATPAGASGTTGATVGGTGAAGTSTTGPRAILVVDDDEATAKLLALTLSRLGRHTTTVATSGASALAVMDGRPFDLVLCDAMMPDLDGPSFVREVRTTKPGYARTPILICSAASPDELDSSFDPPADGWLRKPIGPSKLLAELEPFLGRPT